VKRADRCKALISNDVVELLIRLTADTWNAQEIDDR
jgi:hypothetical protein